MLLHPALQPLLAQFERLSGPAGVVGDCCGTGEPSATEQERERERELRYARYAQWWSMMYVYTDADLYLWTVWWFQLLSKICPLEQAMKPWRNYPVACSILDCHPGQWRLGSSWQNSWWRLSLPMRTRTKTGRVRVGNGQKRSGFNHSTGFNHPKAELNLDFIRRNWDFCRHKATKQDFICKKQRMTGVQKWRSARLETTQMWWKPSG